MVFKFFFSGRAHQCHEDELQTVIKVIQQKSPYLNAQF